MRILEGPAIRIRLYLGENDRWHHQPLPVALVERLRREGFSGATVFHGVSGFGARSILHSTHLLRLSEDLPVVVEIIESEENLPRLEAILTEMAPGELVTVEPVRVLRHGRTEKG